jgi:hypothetical protein
MKYLKIAFGLALVAGLMAVTASSAMAQARWVTCEKVKEGKWKNSLCTEAGAGEWETKAETATSTVTSSGELELEDQVAGTAIKCKGSGTGWVANLSTGNGEDGVTTITATSCSFVKNGECTASDAVTAKARNLPWGTRLVETNGEVRDQIISGSRKEEGNGEPGWAVECTVDGIIKISDRCEHSGNTVGTLANRATGELEEKFDAITKAETMATCSVGGANSGLVNGTLTNKLSNGQALWILATILKT